MSLAIQPINNSLKPVVMFVDDDLVTRKCVEKTLKTFEGISCIVCNGADAAIEQFKKRKLVHLIITDFSMPDKNNPLAKNGDEFAHSIREEESKNSVKTQVPIVCVSSDDLREYENKGVFTATFSKPHSRTQLNTIVQTYLKNYLPSVGISPSPEMSGPRENSGQR